MMCCEYEKEEIHFQKIIDLVNETQGTDVEIGEVFEIEGRIGWKYAFTQDRRLEVAEYSELIFNNHTRTLADLLLGHVNLIQLPFKPKDGDACYLANIYKEEGYEEGTCRESNKEQQRFLDLNMIFKTKEKAQKRSKEILEKIN